MGSIEDFSWQPPPRDERLDWFEKSYDVRLPQSYRRLLRSFNGARIVDGEITVGGDRRLVERFLCLLDVPQDHPTMGWDDITVVLSQVDEMLGGEDEVGFSLIPIAVLFPEDLVCLDYRANCSDPAVVVWDHDRSEEFDPFTIPVTASFDEFFEQLTGGPVAQPGGDPPRRG